MKKIGASVLLLALIVLGAPAAKAISLQDLQNTVKSLQQQVGSLQSQLGLTLTALTNGNMAASSSNVSATATPATPTPTVTPVTPNAYNNATANATANVAANNATATPITPAQQGSSGANVTAIQRALIASGYLNASATGYFGAATAAAVTAFQADNGLSTVGSVGPATAGLLSSYAFPTEAAATAATPSTLTGPSGTVTVTRNMAYGDQYVPAHTTHEKIGSYIVHNGTLETVKLNSMLVGFTTGGTGSVTNLTNLQATVNSVVSGSTLATPTTYNTITASTNIASGTTALVELYADTGAATSGGIRSNLLVGALGLSSAYAYNSGSSYSGQDIEFVAGSTGLCTITSFTASPTTVAPSGSSTLSWNTSNCTAVTVSGTGVSSSLLSGSVTTGPLSATTTYTLTAHGTTGGSITSTLTVYVSTGGNLSLSRNAAFPNQTISANVVNQKIGSYTVQNTTPESITLNSVHIFPTLGTLPLTDLSNLNIYVNGVAVGAPIVPLTDSHVTPSFSLASGAFTTIDVYADVGSMSGTIITSATIGGLGATSGTLYPTGIVTPVTGQTITVTTGCAITPTFVASSSSVSQYVAAGTTTGVTDATQATFNLTSPTAITLTELKLSFVGATSATSARIGSNHATVVSGIAYFAGLGISIPAGMAGTNVTVYISYPPVGVTGVPSGTLSTATLTYLRYNCGSSSNASTFTISAPTMTLVASKPALAVVDSSDPLVNGLVKAGTVVVTADPQGTIAINKIPLTFSSAGSVTIASAINNIVVKDAGGAIIPTTNTTLALAGGGTANTTISFTGGLYLVPPGTSTSFNIYVHAATVTPANIMTMMMGAPTGFLWTDTAGSGVTAAQNGTLIVAYPTNLSTIVSSGTGSCLITSLTAMPTSISAGSTSLLVWNTTGCTTASIAGGTFTTTVPVVGTATTPALTTTTTYTLTASGTTGGPTSMTVTVTVLGSGCTIAPTLFTPASSVSQFVATGTTSGATDATQAVYNLYTTSPGTVVSEMKISVVGGSTATSARVGTSTAAFVGGTAWLTGLSIPIATGGAGTNVTVYISYPPVGISGVASNTTSKVSLTYLKFACGGAVLTSTHSVPAPTMTLVSTKPMVTAAMPTTTLAIGTIDTIDVTVTAAAGGNLKLNSLPFSLGGAGYTYNGALNSLVVKNGSGAVIPTTNTAFPSSLLIPTTITFTGGYVIPAGTSATFKIYVPVTSVFLPHPSANLQAAIFSPASGFSWTDTSGGATAPQIGYSLMTVYPTVFTSNLYN